MQHHGQRLGRHRGEHDRQARQGCQHHVRRGMAAELGLQQAAQPDALPARLGQQRMRAGQGGDAGLDPRQEADGILGAGQPQQGLDHGQRVLGAVVDLPQQQALLLLYQAALGDVGDHAVPGRAAEPGRRLGAELDPARRGAGGGAQPDRAMRRVAAAAGAGGRRIEQRPVGRIDAVAQRRHADRAGGAPAEDRRGLGIPGDAVRRLVPGPAAELGGGEGEAELRLALGQGGGAQRLPPFPRSRRRRAARCSAPIRQRRRATAWPAWRRRAAATRPAAAARANRQDAAAASRPPHARAVRKGPRRRLASPKALASNWPSGPRIARRIPPGGGAPARAVTSERRIGRGLARGVALAGRGCWRPAPRRRRPGAPGRRPPPPGSAPSGRAAAAPAAAGRPPG